jgi:SAM-dependent methyltransferase
MPISGRKELKMNTLTRIDEAGRVRESAAPPLLLTRIRRFADIELDRILELLDARPPSRILEAGCGAGLRTSALAARGYRVTGIDPVGWRIAAARARNTDPGLALAFYKRDLLNFALLDSFDAAIASFAPGADGLDDRRMLLNLSVSLRPGGRLLLDATAGGYTRSSIAEALQKAGFESVKVYGSLEGAAYGTNARKLIVVATR